MSKHYTMIDSRSTPEDIMKLMERLAYKLASENWIVRSGGADGADSCAEDGAWGFILETMSVDAGSSYMEIYLPWKDFNGRESGLSGYYTLAMLPNKGEAEDIASETHPAWERCSQGAKKLHTRNVYQLLGLDLNTPSKFVVCWAQPVGDQGHVKGGTATAVKLGIDNGAEIINLYHKETQERVIKWLEG